jgi:ABC-2 type transport system ATP-binding protein
VFVIRALDEAGIAIDDIGLRRPTLDDVFLSLTGHAAEQEPTDDAADAAVTTATGRAP